MSMLGRTASTGRGCSSASLTSTCSTARTAAGSELKIIAAIPERPVIEKILSHLGLDPQPPPRGRAREAGQDFPAGVALVASTSTLPALRDMAARRRKTLGQP
jgi:hypothetical protein